MSQSLGNPSESDCWEIPVSRSLGIPSESIIPVSWLPEIPVELIMCTQGSKVYLCIILMTCLGEGGYDGDGDITKPENLEEFQKYVLACTENQGVHFVMADGVSALSVVLRIKVSTLLWLMV